MAAQQMFIALQCFQCSTMQVKQQKKSSNKWVCVVCNQKQSVRKVCARGCFARDVRGFVQRFNMSRATSGRESDGAAPAQVGVDVGSDRADRRSLSPPGNGGCPRPRRTDWSEYLDPDEEECGEDGSNEGAISSSPEVVTQMPTETLRRPLQRRPQNLRMAGGEGAFKPTFPKRKQRESPQPQEMDGWKRQHRVAMGGPSRWSEYLPQEDYGGSPVGMDSPEPVSLSWGGEGHGRRDDVRVEEEVHPDFL